MAMPVWPSWREAVRFDDARPGVTLLHESVELKVVLVGLRTGQALPAHPGPAASFVFLQGEATMVVGDEEVSAEAGSVIVVPSGATRAVHAAADTVFVGSLGDPASEHGPH
jgi:quercetin dioxygenase-like cupin family protein